jgi:hypothetical protein
VYFALLHIPGVTGVRSKISVVEYGNRPDWRSGASAPLEWQANELKLTLTEQSFQIAQALYVRDLEFQASLVYE